MLLFVDAEQGLCQTHILPPSLHMLGGRALASLLAQGEGGFAQPKENRLVLAPGLLAHYADVPSARLALSSVLANRSGIAVSSVGGIAALSLARLGFRALFVQGSCHNTLCDLVIDERGGSLVSTEPFPAATDLEARMTILAKRWPEAAGLITVSRLGQHNIPIATTTISDGTLQPASHAGSFSGFLLGTAGIRAIVFLRPHASQSHMLLNQILNDCMQAQKNNVQENSSLSDSLSDSLFDFLSPFPSCSLSCARCERKVTKKGLDFAPYWFFPTPEEEQTFAARYLALCDQLELDAFALAKRLSEHKKTPDLVLSELSRMNEHPDTSPLIPVLQGWFHEKKGTFSSERFLLDTLGLCRFSQSKRKDTLRLPTLLPKLLPTLLQTLLLQLGGQSAQEFSDLEEKVRRVESTLSPALC